MPIGWQDLLLIIPGVFYGYFLTTDFSAARFVLL